MECSKCKKQLKNSDIGGFIDCLGIRKYWCNNCWDNSLDDECSCGNTIKKEANKLIGVCEECI